MYSPRWLTVKSSRRQYRRRYDFAAELQAVIHRQGPQTQGNFRPAEAAGRGALLLINLVQAQIGGAHFDILGILIVFAVFQSQLGRQHLSDPEAAADPKDAAVKLVAVGEKEGLGLDDGQHIRREKRADNC